MKTPSRPSLLLSTVVVFAVTAMWGFLRLYLFSDAILPLTFVLPLLVCIWTGKRWQLWTMAAIFSAMAAAKTFYVLPAKVLPKIGDFIFFGSTIFNIILGAFVVHAILKLRESLEKQNATISAQNAELEAQAEELSQQNEDLKAQSEELAEQNEEIEAQTEEVTRQNEDLVDLNHRLTGREEILQGLLLASRELNSIPRVLSELCHRTLSVVGSPAVAVAILEQKGESLAVISQITADEVPPIPVTWPMTGSIAGIVLKEKRTAYVSDLNQQANLAQPFGQSLFKSVLATPVTLTSANTGLLVACSTETSHWTEEQFRVIEWIAAQCGLVMETLESQRMLTERTKALETANQSKDRFLAMLSHELRTPLTPVLAVSDMLEKDDRLPEDVREDFRMIRRNVSVQSKLIDDLLDLTRISRGKIELDRRILPLSSLLQDTVKIISGDVNAKTQDLQLNLSQLNNCAVVGDGPRLQQVFWNLLKNAIKFSEQGSVIVLQGRLKSGNAVAVEISDSGCGIGPEDLERIFLPFEQIQDKTQNANEGGLGLGLAIAKAIVELHGGKISAKSDGRGRGATFTVELPAAANGSSDLPSPFSETLPRHIANNSPCILLVEDHGDTGRVLARLLRGSGYNVEHAETAAAALRLFKSKKFDVVVSDLGLPDQGGLELMRQLRALQPDIPGICLSGYGTETDVFKCREAGFAEHLTKPIDVNRLKIALSKVTSETLNLWRETI